MEVRRGAGPAKEWERARVSKETPYFSQSGTYRTTLAGNLIAIGFLMENSTHQPVYPSRAAIAAPIACDRSPSVAGTTRRVSRCFGQR